MGEICYLEVIVCNLNMKENAPLYECSKGSFLVPSFWLPVKVTLSKYNGIIYVTVLRDDVHLREIQNK